MTHIAALLLSSSIPFNNLSFQILEVTEETLQSLEPKQKKSKKRSKNSTSESRSERSKVPDGTDSVITKSSKCSKDSMKSFHSIADKPIVPRAPPIPFHIVPNEVYNIDEKIEDLVCRYSDLPIEELQQTYSVYRGGELFVMALIPSTTSKPKLVEIKPRGLVLRSMDIDSCDLIGDQISIKTVGEEKGVMYSQLFLHDTAHLYLLIKKIKEMKEPEPVEESSQLASDRIVISALDELLGDELYSFPCHVFKYSKADVAIPVVVALTDSEVIVIKIESNELLHLNQDILSQILTDNSCDFTLLYREKISNISQLHRSFFSHTVRIEFREESNPFGSPETTFSLIGYNIQDIEILQETLFNKLDSQVRQVSKFFRQYIDKNTGYHQSGLIKKVERNCTNYVI